MNKLIHKSADSAHYNKESQSYDAFNEKNSAIVNHYLEKLFKKYKIKNVLDLSCGTGSQVFWLAKRGFQVIGVFLQMEFLLLMIFTTSEIQLRQGKKFLKHFRLCRFIIDCN